MNDCVDSVWMAEGGRIVIPARFRKEMGLRDGDGVIMELSDGELRLFSVLRGIRRAQETIDERVPPGVSLVDELIADRRREAALG